MWVRGLRMMIGGGRVNLLLGNGFIVRVMF
jgi:hypothetical protein